MTERSYEIRPYRPGDEPSILAGFNRVFREVCGEGYVDRDRAFWSWEFEQNPAGHRIQVAVTPDGEVAAHYAGVPQVCDTAFGEKVFVHAVDSFVLQEHRAGLKRPGLFVNTARPWFDACRDAGDALVYGYPVRVAERIGERYLGYTHVRVVDYLCRAATAGSDAIPGDVDVARVHAIPADVDELYAAMAAARSCLVRRDLHYLDWRYAMPNGSSPVYEFHAARRDGRLVGFVVLRPDHGLVPDACTIADWLCMPGDEDAHAALVATATGVARSRNRQVVMAVFADQSPERASLVASGFEVVPSGTYLERRLGHNSFDERFTTDWLREHWWYTIGDSDLV
ncbi:MAG: hypothetical protein O2865_07295 [Planctomycetota bacterium]|nr:hypothetical protein [Planctomycetota bacterium]MDA0934309.1 hypothetical protein [Planctomycetota bacterium]MDA1222995.1 hypothetical protein [Planctomycetota bacterium]